METQALISNIIDQVKEVWLKLGYTRESIRLYYQLSSVNALLDSKYTDISEAYEVLTKEQGDREASDDTACYGIKLSMFCFHISKGRLEVVIPPQTGEMIRKYAPDNPFLCDLIGMMQTKSETSIDDICAVFRKYDRNYVIKKMEDNIDFDYVLYFDDKSVDGYYYCVKEHGNHCIYHRFMESDYKDLMEV